MGAGAAENARRSWATAAARAADTVREWSANSVDDWGRDPELAARAFLASRARWEIAVGGTEHLPARAGALIVVNARRFSMAPVFAALALSDAVGRPVRFVGRPDVAPIGPMLQRIGGLLPIASEVRSALSDGDLVVLGAIAQPNNATCGPVDADLVAAALATHVRVVPGATLSWPVQRAARVELGTPVRPSRIRRGTLAELELAAAVQSRIDGLLEQLGGSLKSTPFDRLLAGEWINPLDPVGLLRRNVFG